MTNYYIMWHSDENTDPGWEDKYDRLVTILDSHGWKTQGNRAVTKIGKSVDLERAINDCALSAEDCLLMYIDDTIQLGPATIASDKKYLIENIDDKFAGTDFGRILLVTRGKRSGLITGDNYQLILSPKFYRSWSMGPQMEIEEDAYDLQSHLLQYENITWYEVWLSIQAATYEVNASPYHQDGGFESGNSI